MVRTGMSSNSSVEPSASSTVTVTSSPAMTGSLTSMSIKCAPPGSRATDSPAGIISGSSISRIWPSTVSWISLMPASTLELKATISISSLDSLTRVPKIAVISASSAIARTTASSKSKASSASSASSLPSASSSSDSAEAFAAVSGAESFCVESCSELLQPANAKAEAATMDTKIRGCFNIAIKLSPPSLRRRKG